MKKLISTLLISTLFVALLSGCTSQTKSQLATDGSTSMEKVIGALGEAFQNETKINFTYNPTGSSSGIKAVQENRCDIGLSSKALKEDEKNAKLSSFVLANEGIAVIVHKENPIENLTLEQIQKIYTGAISNWSELDGENKAIVLIGREAGSGTRDGFESITKTKNLCKYRQELNATGDVITTVSQNPNAIGYASLAAIKDSVKVLKIDGKVASNESIKDGTYPLQRPFLLVTNANQPLSAEAEKFFEFIKTKKAKEIILNSGAIPTN